MFTAIFAIVFVTTLGYAILKLFLPNKDNLSILSYSYGIGIACITIQMYIYSRIDISWNIISLNLPALFLICGYVFHVRSHIAYDTFKGIVIKKWDLLFLAGISLTFAYVVFQALLRPVSTWDGWAIWLLRSKIFFIDNTIHSEVLKYLHSDYPLVVSLFGTFIYILLGRIDDSLVLLSSVGFYFFTCLLLFSTLKKEFGISYALFFTFLFVTIQNVIRHGGRLEAGQADLPFGYFALSCVVLLLDYIKQTSLRNVTILCIFLGITTLIKLESIPFTIVIVVILIYQILKSKKYNHILSLTLWILPVIDWQLYVYSNSLSNSYLSTYRIISFTQIISVVNYYFYELINIRSWNLLWVVYFYSLMFLRIKQKIIYIFNIIILSQLLMYLVLYFFISRVFNPESSLERLLVHIAPIVMLYLAYISKETRIGVFFTDKYKNRINKRYM